MTYNSLADPSFGGYGIWNNVVHVLYAKENCSPQLTAKITLKHTCRNQIRVRMGVSTDQTFETPEYIIGFPVFDFQGGCQYMQGGTDIEDHKTIEFGLDLTPLLNLVGSNTPARYFLLIDEDNPNNWSTGQIVQYSIIDYTTGVNEIACIQSNVPIINNSLTKLWVDHTVNYGEISIDDEVLPNATIFEQYSHQLNASGGDQPYYWDFDLNFNDSYFSSAFPTINTVQLNPSDNDDGYAIQNLDFSFPFYDNEFDQVKVYVDGHIMFEDLFSWPYSVYDFFNFTKNKYIAPFMADLQIYPADNDGIWYVGDANSASFRWKVAVSGQSATTELNFAVKLFKNGDIRFYYGGVNNYSNLEWISGLSAGDNKYYQFSEFTNDPVIPGYFVCELTRSARPEEFYLNHYGIIEGQPENVYDNLGIKVKATDENNITTSKEVFISTEGSFLMVDSVMVSSGGDDVIEYGETADLTVTVKCLGNEPITGASMEILIDDQYINILDNTEILGNFTPGEIKTFTNAFSFEVSNSVPNNYEITFLAPINDNSGNEWVNNILLTAYSPEIYMGNVSINDGNNGYIDPGENCDLVIDLFNYGGATAYNIVSTLSSTDPYVTINNNTGYLPSLSPYGIGANATYNITVASDVLIGHSLDFSLDISADLGISSTHIFSLVVGHPSILIIDLDPNNNSAPLMETSFDVLGVSYDITTLFPPNLNTYSGIFVCLGIYNDNHVLTSGEGQLLADYLDTGGNLYMEGGDTWYYDSQTAVHSMFNINGESDGTSDLSIINGQSGTFTDGMSFSYSGENSYIDHISPISPAMLILENQSPVYGTGVAYDASTYKTIGTSHEFGGLTDGVLPSTKEELLRNYLEFFDLLPPPVYSLDLKVYLEGPFSATGMNTDLNTNNLLPFQQPYNIYPWYYNGTENVSVIPNADIVDWVLIELRDTTAVEFASSESIITRQVAFLLKDGSIVRLDGTSRLQFNNLIEHQLFVVVWQRNHLGILSANALTGFNDVYYYDFTSYENQVYGGNSAHKEISPGIWGLISGDGNCDGQINPLDLSTIWSIQAGKSIYEMGDFNMDGNIDNKDKNDIFILNEGYSSQVPD